MILVPDDEQTIRNLITEARQISIALPALEPLLAKRRANAFARLMGNYRDGKHMEQMSVIAELFVLETITQEINSKLENLNLKEK